MKLSDKQKGYLYLYGPFVVLYLLFLIFAPGFTLFMTAAIGIVCGLGILALAIMLCCAKGAKMVQQANPGVKFWWDF